MDSPGRSHDIPGPPFGCSFRNTIPEDTTEGFQDI